VFYTISIFKLKSDRKVKFSISKWAKLEQAFSKLGSKMDNKTMKLSTRRLSLDWQFLNTTKTKMARDTPDDFDYGHHGSG
jgi:hypothetical protein